jgi:hypothetical protein
MTKLPISKKCPKCQGIDFKRVRPERYLAFTDDRVCKSCGTKYAPPTPLWAAVVFIVAGVLFLLVDVAAVWVLFARRVDFWFLVRVSVLLLLTLALGIKCVLYGLGCIRRQEDVPAMERQGWLK